MATSVIGMQGRRLSIDSKNIHQPGSVFITGGRAFAMEISREAFLAAVCKEFDLVPRDAAPMLVAA